MSENIKDGKVEVMGINIDISQVLGQKIVDQYIAQLRDEDIETLMKYISEDLFTKTYSGDLAIKQREKNSWGDYVEKKFQLVS